MMSGTFSPCCLTNSTNSEIIALRCFYLRVQIEKQASIFLTYHPRLLSPAHIRAIKSLGRVALHIEVEVTLALEVGLILWVRVTPPEIVFIARGEMPSMRKLRAAQRLFSRRILTFLCHCL